MRKMGLFLLILGASALGLVFLVAWYLGSYQMNGGTFQGMMGQMMGGGSTGMAQPMPGSVWVTLVALLAFTLVGVVGMGYYVTYPEIRTGTTAVVQPTGVEREADPGQSWSVLMRTSKPDEKLVLESLAAHGGTYLQKFVVKDTGLSKLKTHRIVSRLAERGVVAVKRSGNTNEQSLAQWVKDEFEPKPQ